MAIQVSIGRIRRTVAASPSEAAYITHMNAQSRDMMNILQGVIDKFPNVTANAILHAVKPIMNRSQELVPVDTGRLQRSAFTEARAGKSGVRAAIGYAKYGQPHYAAFVHEMVHIPRAKGKSAKFLERAINEKLREFTSELVNYIRTNMGLA